MNRLKAQSTIELIVAFICIFMLLIASARVFVWFTKSLAERHQAFEDTRNIRGSGGLSVGSEDVQDLKYTPEPLKLF